MPITIGTVTSNVNVADGAGRLSREQMEEVVRIVIERLKREKVFKEREGEEGDVPGRRSES